MLLIKMKATMEWSTGLNVNLTHNITTFPLFYVQNIRPTRESHYCLTGKEKKKDWHHCSVQIIHRKRCSATEKDNLLVQKQASTYQSSVIVSRSDISADCEPVAAEDLCQVALHLVQNFEALSPGVADGGSGHRGSLLDGAVHGRSVVAHPSTDILDVHLDLIKPVDSLQLLCQEAQVVACAGEPLDGGSRLRAGGHWPLKCTDDRNCIWLTDSETVRSSRTLYWRGILQQHKIGPEVLC